MLTPASQKIMVPTAKVGANTDMKSCLALLLSPSTASACLLVGLFAWWLVANQDSFYSFATFNLNQYSGYNNSDPRRIAYGHLGATYGYDSILMYFPVRCKQRCTNCDCHK